MWTHVTERFHAYHRAHRTPDGRIIHLRRKKLVSDALKDARKSLKYLQRANDGHVQHLYTVLAMTYGRVGKRRRQLMSKLQALSPVDDDSSVAVLSQQVLHQKLGNQRTKVPQLSDEALAILKSQVKQDSTRFDRARLKESQPHVPAVNAWGRPFPERRKANFIKRWYAMTLERLMPPLEVSEWERLRGLATGGIRWPGPIKRRKLGTRAQIERPRDTASLPLALRVPHRLTSSIERVMDKGFHKDTRTNPHNFSPRFMRSMWSRVFRKCPRLDWSDEKKKWMVTWGSIGKEAELSLDPQRTVPWDMFADVDDHGRVLKTA
ncbi:MAG: hypothetical protein Q9181_005615 [Wetmoreana brouardii]